MCVHACACFDVYIRVNAKELRSAVKYEPRTKDLRIETARVAHMERPVTIPVHPLQRLCKRGGATVAADATIDIERQEASWMK